MNFDLKLGTNNNIFSRDKEKKKLKLLFSHSSFFLVVINIIIQLNRHHPHYHHLFYKQHFIIYTSTIAPFLSEAGGRKDIYKLPFRVTLDTKSRESQYKLECRH